MCYSKNLKNFKYKEKGIVAADYSLWCSMLENNIKMDYIDKIQALRNGLNNDPKNILKLYNSKLD